MSRRIVIVPDLQVPFHSRGGVEALAQFIEDYKPDQVVCVGDLIDMPQIDVISRANHEDRLWKSLSQRLPGLLDLPELRIENFLKLDEMNVVYSHEPFKLAPGWYLLHGDESAQSSKSGMTASNLSQKLGASVAIGHTHKLGLIPTTHMVGGVVTRTDWGFEVGCILDFKSSGFKYMKGMANWTQGFGMLHVDGKTVTPTPVPIINKSFVVEGEKYSWKK